MHLCICLSISKVNVSNDTGDEKEELGLFCCYKVLTPSVNGIVLFESELGCKYTL